MCNTESCVSQNIYEASVDERGQLWTDKSPGWRLPSKTLKPNLNSPYTIKQLAGRPSPSSYHFPATLSSVRVCWTAGPNTRK